MIGTTHPPRMGSATVCRIAGLLAALASQAAHAHHPMGGQMPATLAQGLLSGLAHPVIELDHLLFLLGAAVLVAAAKLPVRAAATALLVFVLAGAAGTLLHARGMALPAAEIGIALTLLAVAAGLLRPRLSAGAAVGLAVLAGLLHGYAFGEAVVGAEATPQVAYLLGLAAVQSGMVLAVQAAWQRLAVHRAGALRPLRLGAAVALSLFGLLMLRGLA